MNKKRKILTLVALAVFSVIIFFHYYRFNYRWEFKDLPGIHDVRMPLFVLGVFYAALFFLFGGKDAEPVPRRPRNWRRIIGAILAGLVIAGLSAAIIYSHEVDKRKEATRQANIEYEKRKEAANIEEEASKHRITESEIDLINLRLGRRLYETVYDLTGRIRNRAAHNSTLNSITLTVRLHERRHPVVSPTPSPSKGSWQDAPPLQDFQSVPASGSELMEGSPDIVGEEPVEIRVEVPPHQTRAFYKTIDFKNSPNLTEYAWTYAITEIRGSAGGDGVTPTPLPKP